MSKHTLADSKAAVLEKTKSLAERQTNITPYRRYERRIVADLDTARLPEGLRAKVQRRAVAYGDPHYRDLHDVLNRQPGVSESAGYTVIGTALVDLILLFWAVNSLLSDGSIHLVEGILFVVAALATAAAAVMLVIRVRRHPLRLHKRERQTIRWHYRCHHLWPDYPRSPEEPLSRALALTLVGLELCHNIISSRAWRTEHLDTHRVRLDLSEETAQLYIAYTRLKSLHNTVADAQADPRDTSPAGLLLKRPAAEYQKLYDEAFEAFVQRVAALHQYKQQLDQIDGMLENLDRAKRIAYHDDFSAHYAAITGHTITADRTATLSRELDELRDRLRVELAFLSSNIVHAEALASPLHTTGS